MRFLWLIVLAFLESQVRGGTNGTLVADYAPFLNGKPWPRVSVIKYAESASNVWVHPQDPKHFPSIQEVRDPDSDFTTVIIRYPNGTAFKTYNNPVLGPHLAAVYSGDFNNDGIPDFMAIKPGSGCGLAGEYCTGVFAFSDGSDFRFTRVTMMGLGPHDLVLDTKTKTFRLIHTSFRQGKSSDGRVHSFWVHRFYRWDNGGFKRDTGLEPVWVQYLSRPNHEATKLLTPALKMEAWNEDPESEARIEW